MQPGQNLSKNKLNTALRNTPKRLLAWGPQLMYQLIGALNLQIHFSQTKHTAFLLPPSCLPSLTVSPLSIFLFSLSPLGISFFPLLGLLLYFLS